MHLMRSGKPGDDLPFHKKALSNEEEEKFWKGAQKKKVLHERK